jgi:hypothetical protein
MQFKPLLQLFSPEGSAIENESTQHIEVLFEHCNARFHVSAEFRGIDSLFSHGRIDSRLIERKSKLCKPKTSRCSHHAHHTKHYIAVPTCLAATALNMQQFPYPRILTPIALTKFYILCMWRWPVLLFTDVTCSKLDILSVFPMVIVKKLQNFPISHNITSGMHNICWCWRM